MRRQPGRGYSWPPLQPGHTLSLQHGAYSPRTIAERAVDVHDKLLEVAPWLAEEAFIPEVDRYVRAASREVVSHEAVMASAQKTGTVSPRLLEACTAAARLASQLAKGLGLSPIGYAELRALTAVTDRNAAISNLAEKGRVLRVAQGHTEDD